jgi:hypothetical protein
MVNWPPLHVSGPLPHVKVLEKLARKKAWPRKLTLPNVITKFLPFSAVWMSILQSCFWFIYLSPCSFFTVMFKHSSQHIFGGFWMVGIC